MNSCKWDVTGGAVKANETSREAAARETLEEIGVEIDQSKLELIERHVSSKHIIDIYFIKMDVEVNRCTLQEEEVTEVRFFKKDELLKILKEHDIKDEKYFNIIKETLLKITG